jgi:hypothetical protein
LRQERRKEEVILLFPSKKAPFEGLFLPVQAQPLTDSRHIGLQQLQGKALGPEFRACRLIGNGGVHVLQAELKTLPQPGRSGSKYRRQKENW